jgi:putative flippase GtrA
VDRAFAAAGLALRARRNWIQLAKFCVVGSIGYGVNLGVYSLLLNWANLNYLIAAVGSFAVAVTNNYLLNRYWTFHHQRGHFAYQGMRFLVVSLVSLGANLLILHLLISAGLGKIVGQAVAIILVTPLNFVGNKLWSFRR